VLNYHILNKYKILSKIYTKAEQKFKQVEDINTIKNEVTHDVEDKAKFAVEFLKEEVSIIEESLQNKFRIFLKLINFLNSYIDKFSEITKEAKSTFGSFSILSSITQSSRRYVNTNFSLNSFDLTLEIDRKTGKFYL